jgi:hypothetical protein
MSESERTAAVRDDEQPTTHGIEVSETPGPSVDSAEPTAAEPIWSAKGPADGAGEPGVPVMSGQETRSRPDGRRGLPRPRNLVLIGAAVAVLVLGAVSAPIAWEMWNEKEVHIATPPSVAGLVLDDSQGAHDTIDYLRTAVETGVSLKTSTGAVYADESGESRSVLFVGGTGAVGSPDEVLTKTFGLITDNAGGVESVHEVPAGPLGGTMRCGTTRTDGGSMAVCGWADHGSLGIAMFPNRPVEQSAELLRTMRKALQDRG